LLVVNAESLAAGLLDHIAGNDELLDLAGTFVQAEEAHVAVEALNAVIGDIAGAAEDLDRAVAKTNAGMGSLYRSQHELLPLFKKGTASHVNNISLGKRGRHRTNLWIYPGASSVGSDARKGLQDHPTVKPTTMLQDAMLDLTNRSEIVLDHFLGSGSTLLAAERTGRVCCGVELDPLYVDVIIRRYETATGNSVTLADTDEPFEEVASRRRNEESDDRQ
jgi:hypothetical protein